MNRHVRIVRRAREDVHRIYRWIEARSPRGAAAWYLAFWKAAERIGENAESYGVAPESTRLQRELQNAFFKTRRGRRYRIVFEVIKDEALILRVRGPGQRFLRVPEVPRE